MIIKKNTEKNSKPVFYVSEPNRQLETDLSLGRQSFAWPPSPDQDSWLHHADSIILHPELLSFSSHGISPTPSVGSSSEGFAWEVSTESELYPNQPIVQMALTL